MRKLLELFNISSKFSMTILQLKSLICTQCNLRPSFSSYHLINHHPITSCLRANMEHIEGHYLRPSPLTLCPPPPVLLSHSHRIPFPKTHSSPTCNMTDQSGSSRFQALLESAVQAYEKKEGVALADSVDSLAMRLQRCHSVDDIATFLQRQAQAIDDFQQRDRIFKSIKAIVSILSPVSSVTSVADDVGLVCWEVLTACFTSLTHFYRHYSYMQRQYTLLSVSY